MYFNKLKHCKIDTQGYITLLIFCTWDPSILLDPVGVSGSDIITYNTNSNQPHVSPASSLYPVIFHEGWQLGPSTREEYIKITYWLGNWHNEQTGCFSCISRKPYTVVTMLSSTAWRSLGWLHMEWYLVKWIHVCMCNTFRKENLISLAKSTRASMCPNFYS